MGGTAILAVSCIAAATGSSDAALHQHDTSGPARGIDAIVIDPAAMAAVDFREFQLRTRLEEGAGSAPRDYARNLGVYGLWPIGPLRLGGGYEWLALDEGARERGRVALAWTLSRYAGLGLGYTAWRSRDDAVSREGVWDVGVHSEPTRWLALSIGMDNFNRAGVAGKRRSPLLRTGLGLRPWWGAPILTLGADTRSTNPPLRLMESRFFIELAPWSALRLFAAHTRTRDESAWWAGLALGGGGLELAAAASPESGPLFTLSARPRPFQSTLILPKRTVHITLASDLRQAGGLFLRPPALPIAALELEAAAEDPSVQGVVITIRDLDVGFATVGELRRSIMRMRERGKRVVVRLGNSSEHAYMIAAAADEIRLDPHAVLELDGFALTVNYYADTLAKLGVRFDAVAIGRYKSAPDQLTRAEPSPNDASVHESILQEIYEDLLAVLIHQRGIAPSRIEALLERGSFVGVDALEAGLVDALIDVSAPAVAPLFSTEPPDPTSRPSDDWGQLPIIAVVPVQGIITLDGGPSLLGATSSARDTIVALGRAALDPDVAGIVLRIDSPGGDVFASEILWRAVRAAAERKPVVASMGETAASGGYYVACGADAVLAEGATLTGSIGIFAVHLDLSELYERAAVRPYTYKRGALADLRSESSSWSVAEQERVRRLLERYYETFLERVSAGRSIPMEQVRELAEGRVYTGRQAEVLGLVDALGGLGDAISEVRARAGVLDREYVIDIPRASMSLDALASRLALAPTSQLAWVTALQAELEALDERLLALMPTSLDVR